MESTSQLSIPSPSTKLQKFEKENFTTSLKEKNMEGPNSIVSPLTVKSADNDGNYGIHYPNKIFVGLLPGKANASDLTDFFQQYGAVLEGKIVLDEFGQSKRFGFVTFKTTEDAKNVLSRGDLYLKGKRISVGPAVKKSFCPEISPSGEQVGKSECAENSDETTDEEIVTIPPVNEKENSASSSKNIWRKVNVQLKHEYKPQYKKKLLTTQKMPHNEIYTLAYEEMHPVYQYLHDIPYMRHEKPQYADYYQQPHQPEFYQKEYFQQCQQIPQQQLLQQQIQQQQIPYLQLPTNYQGIPHQPFQNLTQPNSIVYYISQQPINVMPHGQPNIMGYQLIHDGSVSIIHPGAAM